MNTLRVASRCALACAVSNICVVFGLVEGHALAKPPLQRVTPPIHGIVFPAGAGVLNVRAPRFGAKGDGKTDDTSAIQKALTMGLAQHRIVYLPDGVYLVSDTLKWQDAAQAGNNVQGWGPFLQLQGQSQAGTIIRLRDAAPGFADEAAPKAVVQTGSSGSDGNKRYSNGEGNEAFENHLRDFSVETGHNAGAIAIDYQASNVGAMRHVSLSGDGYCGIALTRRDNGPALLKDVSVTGFRFGVRVGQEIADFTLEDLTLRHQRETGLWLRDGVVGVRHLHSQNSVPALQLSGVALLALFDSDLTGGTSPAAIACLDDAPHLYVRNLKTSGYGGSVLRAGTTQAATLVEWSSDAPLGNANGALSLHLPIRDTPGWYESDPQKWTIVPPPSGGDDTAAVQAALDAGRSTVFFGFGRYVLSDTLRVPGSVKRLQGAGTSLDVRGTLPEGKPLFRCAGGTARDLTIVDRFAYSTENTPFVAHEDARTLVLRDIIPFGGSLYRSVRGAGPLFLEDVAGAGYTFAPGTQVWARQWNLEGRGQPKMVNDGATVWALGTKHESLETIWDNRGGGRLEAWAGLSYTFGGDRNTPAALNTNSSLALQMAGTTYLPNGFFDLLVKDTQAGTTTETRHAQVIGRGGGAFVPLYVNSGKANF